MSEAVYNILQIGKQTDTTTASAARVLLPVDAGSVIDEDRSPASPDEDYGENTAHQPGRGTYGVRGSSLSITGEVRAEDFIEILSMHGAGGITPGGGAGAYVWAFPWDLTTDTRLRMTIEAGTIGDTKAQWRAVGCLINSLEFGFDALTAPGNVPWKFTASVEALYREASNLTAGLTPYPDVETLEGHMTDLYEGPTSTAYDSLGLSAATLKSFKVTSDLGLVRRIYGGSVDYASAYGQSQRKAVTFTAELGINTTSQADVHNVYTTAGALMVERRWRLLARGSRLTTQSEVQVLTMSTAGGAAGGGTFTLSFEGATTPALPYNETNSNVQIALRALPTINGANVGVSGSAGGPYTVTFAGNRANQPQLLIQANTALVTGAGSPYTMTVVRTVPGGQLKTLTIDGRVRFHVVNIGNVDGEMVYAVEGVYVKDPVANSGTGTDLRVTLLNGVATQLSLPVIAEPVPLVPMDDGNFATDGTRTVVLGDCRCPGRPHEQDTAEVHEELPWDVLVDVGMLTGGAAYRYLVLASLVSWNLTDAEGEPVPIEADTVRRLRPDRLDPIATAVNEAYERAKAPLPNASGAPSRRSRRVSASQDPTIRPRAKRTR